MGRTQTKRLLFTGYAPVHFICFRPIYQRLRRVPGLTIHLSGEPSRADKGDPEPTAEGAATLYRPFHIPRKQVVPLPRAMCGEYDMVLCAHVSGYFPARDRERVQIFHGLSFRNMAVRRDVLIYDHLFLTGPYMMRAFQESRLLRPGDPRCLRIGFPKVDRLVDGSLDQRAILRRLGFTGRRPVILYAPTGQRHNSMETVGEEVIRRLRRTGRYDLLIKLHDHPRDKSVNWPTRLRPMLDSHTRLANGYDIVPLLYAADLLITDASSVSSEYSLLDRPMVFLDVPELLEAARQKGVLLDLGTWGRRGGVTVRWPDEAVEAVAWSLAHPKHASPIRRAMARDLFYNPGRAAEAATSWILERLGLSNPAAGERLRNGAGKKAVRGG